MTTTVSDSQIEDSSDQSDELSPLAAGMQTDRDTDRRSCPHEDCHGHLELTDEDPPRVCCVSCRCTPSGTYLPPDDSIDEDSDDPAVLQTGSVGQCVQFTFFYPNGGPTDTTFRWFSDRESYESGTTKMAGGFEAVYDEDEDNRPYGVGDEYTFDLSTL